MKAHEVTCPVCGLPTATPNDRAELARNGPTPLKVRCWELGRCDQEGAS